MQITLNGKEKQLEGPCSIAELIESVGQNPQRVAIQQNGSIVKRDQYASRQVQADDVIEMLQFVGGGSGPLILQETS